MINIHNEVHYVFKHNIGKRKTLKLKTEVLRKNANMHHPLLFTVRFHEGSQGWQLPFQDGNSKTPIHQVDKTLCLVESNEDTELTVVISTSSPNEVTFKLQMIEVNDFFIRVDNDKNHTVKDLSVSSTDFVHVDLSSINGLVQIKVTSEEDICALVSVQPMKCPVASSAEDVFGSGSWQTMLKLGAFAVNTRDYPNDGFYLSFLTLPGE